MFDLQDNLTRVRRLIHQLNQANSERWHHYGLPTFRFWLLLAFLLLPWLLWSRLVDRSRLLELLLTGMLISLWTILLDMAGYFLDFWFYPVEMIPMVPGAWPFDLAMIPVAYMLLQQYARSWRSYLAALCVMALVYAFIGEPMCIRLGLVIYYKWTYVYSVAVYLVFGISVRALVEKLMNRQKAALS
jgi:hypothetical protein